MPKKAIIVDVDGTLVDVKNIQYLLNGGTRFYDEYHQRSIHCPPIESVAGTVRAVFASPNIRVLIVTAREDRWERLTRDWLHRHAIGYHELHMRKTGDFRSNREIKMEIFTKILEGFDVIAAFDDSIEIVELLENLGIRTVFVST